MPLSQIPVYRFSVYRGAFVGRYYEVHVVERMEPEIVVGVLGVVYLIISAFVIVGNGDFPRRGDFKAVQHGCSIG